MMRGAAENVHGRQEAAARRRTVFSLGEFQAAPSHTHGNEESDQCNACGGTSGRGGFGGQGKAGIHSWRKDFSKFKCGVLGWLPVA